MTRQGLVRCGMVRPGSAWVVQRLRSRSLFYHLGYGGLISRMEDDLLTHSEVATDASVTNFPPNITQMVLTSHTPSGLITSNAAPSPRHRPGGTLFDNRRYAGTAHAEQPAGVIHFVSQDRRGALG